MMFFLRSWTTAVARLRRSYILLLPREYSGRCFYSDHKEERVKKWRRIVSCLTYRGKTSTVIQHRNLRGSQKQNRLDSATYPGTRVFSGLFSDTQTTLNR
jgi:hypothetical protein